MSESDSPAVFLPFAPVPDRDSGPYWNALAAGRFELQRCRSCRTLRWPARAICNRCRSFESEWEEVNRRGTIVSWIRTHQAFAPALREAVPYRVVQVALDIQSDLLLIGGWQSRREPVSGEAVELVILEGPEQARLPCWKPV